MKTIVLIAIIFSVTSAAAAHEEQRIHCGSISFTVPKKIGDLPKIDLDYPSKVQIFSFRDHNLLLIANDAKEISRVRLVITAQFNKSTDAYEGQIITDNGGNQIQIDNGTISCTVASFSKRLPRYAK